VAATFQDAFDQHGVPASVLTDNGMVFTTRFAGGRRGRRSRNSLETLLAEHCVEQKNSSPNHPQTCGKVERFHQTEKKWLAAQPTARTLAQLQQQLDALRDYYNTRRPHRALGRSRSATPAAAYAARPKATPSTAYTPPTHERVRHDRIDDSGCGQSPPLREDEAPDLHTGTTSGWSGRIAVDSRRRGGEVGQSMGSEEAER
jgi:hypothetical protein